MEMRYLLGVFGIMGAIILIIIAAVSLMCCGFEYADYVLDKTMCNVYEGETLIYEAPCHNVYISSIGENGYTKKVIVGEGILNMKPIFRKTGDNLRIEGRK